MFINGIVVELAKRIMTLMLQIKVRLACSRVGFMYEIQGKQKYYHILHKVSVIQQVQWTFSSRKYICKIDNWIITIAPHFSIINSQVSKTEYNIRVLLIRGSRVMSIAQKILSYQKALCVLCLKLSGKFSSTSLPPCTHLDLWCSAVWISL